MAPILEVKGITKNFGGLKALDNVSFKIEEGRIIGMIGPNGAGKTTLFNTVTGFLSPDSGKVIYNGENITNLEPHKICKKGLTRTFQIVKPLEELTVLENVLVGAYNQEKRRSEAEEIAEKQLEFVGLEKQAQNLAKELQAGVQKKLELARILATNPQMILLDELLSGLNPREVNETLELIEKVRDDGVTVFFIEHIMSAIMSISESIIVLHHGEKISEGSPEEVSEDESVIEAYLGDKHA